MSLFGALYTGAAGMMAQSSATAMVAQNIANVSTTGYKRSEAFFNELVTSSNFGPWNGPGSVQATRVLRAGAQGAVQQTGIDTDAAIYGNGFFAVRPFPDDTAQMLYTRNGAFSEDGDGYLRNTAGYILYAWPYGTGGTLTTGDDISSLEPVRVDVLDLTPIATTSANLAINLDARVTPYDTYNYGYQLPAGALPTQYTRALTVYDGRSLSDTVTNADISHSVTFNFRHVTGPMAHFTSNISGQLKSTDALIGNDALPAISVGDVFTIQVTGGAAASPLETYQFVDTTTGDDIANNKIATVHGLLEAIRSHGTGDELYARITDNGQLLVQSVDPSATISLTAPGANNPIYGSGTLNIIPDPDGAPADMTFEPDFDITAAADPLGPYPDQGDFPDFANITNPSPFGWWEVSVDIPDPSDPSSTIEARRGLINFNGNGTLNALPGAGGSTVIDLSTTPIDFDPAVTGDEVGFNVDIGHLSQYSADFTTLAATQNGAGAGERIGVQITEDGIVQSRYSNGLNQNLYRIPLALFSNPEGLQDLSGTAFADTDESGSPVLALAGESGAGTVNPDALESANVDIGEEFSRMIVSQRSYTLSSKVITTIDQMTQRLSELAR